jgi:hypothetical protein
VVGRGVVAAIAAVGDDAGEARADLRLNLRDDGREGVAVIRAPGSALTWAMNCPPFERLSVVATDTLTPNSYGRRALPLPMHSTSGACSE